jgi:hypothetical protein
MSLPTSPKPSYNCHGGPWRPANLAMSRVASTQLQANGDHCLGRTVPLALEELFCPNIPRKPVSSWSGGGRVFPMCL